MCLLLSCSEKKDDKSVLTVTIEPLRYFVEASRMIFLKGSRLADLLPHFTALLAAGALLGLWAVKSYRKR